MPFFDVSAASSQVGIGYEWRKYGNSKNSFTTQGVKVWTTNSGSKGVNRSIIELNTVASFNHATLHESERMITFAAVQDLIELVE